MRGMWYYNTEFGVCQMFTEKLSEVCKESVHFRRFEQRTQSIVVGFCEKVERRTLFGKKCQRICRAEMGARGGILRRGDRRAWEAHLQADEASAADAVCGMRGR